ncbi:MAG: DUF3089 domain-containing protein [Bacteroidales bacterium]|nr:DUF3089 domain-containing protein [Bacteroidales bacterium]
MKITLRLLCSFFVISCLILLLSCEKSDITEQNSVTDYSKQEHWLSLPTDASKVVDVFYVYPTAWYKEDTSEPDFCAIDNRIMLIGSQSAFNRQATAFETIGNIYAPYYRQADASYILPLSENQRWNVIDSIPAKDVTAAFDYYIKHYNNGKPFILVGHSQGSNVLLLLLKNYMYENVDVYARMVCAYVIGYPVTAEFLNANKHLKFAEGDDDTGVIVSFNTQSPSLALGANIVMANKIGLVINPINWKKDETLATASESLGSYMPIDSQGNSGKVLNVADARINLKKGVIECSSVNDSAMFKISGIMGLGVYHSFDIPFYYYNLRENAEKRVKNFLGQ